MSMHSSVEIRRIKTTLPESAIEFRFHNNKYQALIGTNEKSEWCDVVSKGGKLIASSDTKIYNLSERKRSIPQLCV